MASMSDTVPVIPPRAALHPDADPVAVRRLIALAAYCWHTHGG